MPFPVAPLTTVSHDALLVAVHAHPEGAVTGNEIRTPVAVCVVDHTPNVYEHGTPASVTENVDAPIVMVPVRVDAAVFAATAYVTVLLPTPDAPLVIVIQLALLTAVQVVDEPVAIAILPLPPAAAKLAVEGNRENCGAAAPCVTASVRPAITMAPDRAVVAVLAARE